MENQAPNLPPPSPGGDGEAGRDWKDARREVKKLTTALLDANALKVDQGRIIAARNERIRFLEDENRTLNQLALDREVKVEELDNHLATAIAEGETYWRAAEALKANLSTLESRCGDEGELRARIDELEGSMTSLRSLREQAERRAVAEVKAQSEADTESEKLRSKAESQQAAIASLSEEVVQLRRKLEGAASDAASSGGIDTEQSGCGPEADLADDSAANHDAEENQDAVWKAALARAESSAAASNALYVEERLQRVAAEQALQEHREIEAQAAAKRRSAAEMEKRNLGVKVREAIRTAVSSSEEACSLRLQVQALEEELVVCKSRLTERQTAMDALIDEFDHFRSSSLQEAQDELDEVCQVVEIQQSELERLRSAASHAGLAIDAGHGSDAETKGRAEDSIDGSDDATLSVAGDENDDPLMLTDTALSGLMHEHSGQLAARDRQIVEAVDAANQSARALAEGQKLQEARNARMDALVHDLMARDKSTKREIEVWKLKCIELEGSNGDMRRYIHSLRTALPSPLLASPDPATRRMAPKGHSGFLAGHSPRTPPKKKRAMKRSARVVSPASFEHGAKRQGRHARV